MNGDVPLLRLSVLREYGGEGGADDVLSMRR
jgi:hypothetical protein